MTPAMYAKAIVGAVVAGLTALAAAMDSAGITGAEWVGIAVTTLSTFGSVYMVPNAPRNGVRADRGAMDPLYALVVVLVVCVIAWVLSSIFGFPGN